MKKVLSLLVVFVFLQVQSWALSGGPTYGAVNNSVSGTYAGTLIGTLGSNALGLFDVGIPPAGLGSGQFAFYVGGTTGGASFFGAIIALADGEKNTMSGVFKGALIRTEALPIVAVGGGGGANVTETIDAADMGGQFFAKITGDTGGTTAIGVGARLTGTASASVTINNNIFGFPETIGVPAGTVTLTMDGFQQSSAVTGQVSLNSLTQTNATGGGG